MALERWTTPTLSRRTCTCTHVSAGYNPGGLTRERSRWGEAGNDCGGVRCVTLTRHVDVDVAGARRVAPKSPAPHSGAIVRDESDEKGLARGDREWPLNEAQHQHVRGVRVALGTGYNRVRGIGRSSGKRRRELISNSSPPPLQTNHCIACGGTRLQAAAADEKQAAAACGVSSYGCEHVAAGRVGEPFDARFMSAQPMHVSVWDALQQQALDSLVVDLQCRGTAAVEEVRTEREREREREMELG